MHRILFFALIALPAAAAPPVGTPPACETCVCIERESCCTGAWDATCTALATGVCSTSCSAGTCVGAPLAESLRNSGCSSRYWVGRVNTGAVCPVPAAGWTGGPLFPGAGVTSPGDLARYCAYTWGGASEPTPAQIAALPDYLGVSEEGWMDCDCAAAAPAGGTAETMMADLAAMYARSFRTAAEGVTDLPEAAKPRTWLTVVDNHSKNFGLDNILQPGGGALVGSSDHGRQLASIATELASPADGGSCGARLEASLALPIITAGSVGTDAHYGRQQHVASALWRSLEAWRATPTSKQLTNERLVLNLSLGWDPIYQCDDAESGKRRVSAEAVRSALRHAACYGALVFAAAGNDPGGLVGGPGPAYPGAWERELAPTLAECRLTCAGKAACLQTRPNFDPRACPGGGAACYRPLVHAVAGVDAVDQPIASTRAGGRPRLAAPAFEAMAGPIGDPSGLHEAALTGSSVAAVVASSIAAVVWQHSPALTPGQVVDVMYEAGAALAPAIGDFCAAPGPCGAIRRVGLCRTLGKAFGWKAASLGCSLVPAFGGTRPAPGWSTVDLLTMAASALWDVATDVADQLVVAAAPLGCGIGTVQVAPVGSLDSEASVVCPDRVAASAAVAPWDVAPQPGVDPCGQCLLVMDDPSRPGTATLYMQANPRLTNPLLDARLVLANGTPARTIRSIDLTRALPMVFPGDLYQVRSLPVDDAVLAFDHVGLAFRSADGTRYVSAPIAIVRGP